MGTTAPVAPRRNIRNTHERPELPSSNSNFSLQNVDTIPQYTSRKHSDQREVDTLPKPSPRLSNQNVDGYLRYSPRRNSSKQHNDRAGVNNSSSIHSMTHRPFLGRAELPRSQASSRTASTVESHVQSKVSEAASKRQYTSRKHSDNLELDTLPKRSSRLSNQNVDGYSRSSTGNTSSKQYDNGIRVKSSNSNHSMTHSSFLGRAELPRSQAASRTSLTVDCYVQGKVSETTPRRSQVLRSRSSSPTNATASGYIQSTENASPLQSSRNRVPPRTTSLAAGYDAVPRYSHASGNRASSRVNSTARGDAQGKMADATPTPPNMSKSQISLGEMEPVAGRFAQKSVYYSYY